MKGINKEKALEILKEIRIARRFMLLSYQWYGENCKERKWYKENKRTASILYFQYWLIRKLILRKFKIKRSKGVNSIK